MPEKTPIPKSIVDEILDSFISKIQDDERISESIVQELTALRTAGQLNSPDLVERALNSEEEAL